jgi:hypothetical protein
MHADPVQLRARQQQSQYPGQQPGRHRARGLGNCSQWQPERHRAIQPGDNNGSWGILLTDYADYTPATVPTYCQGGELSFTPPSPYDLLYAPLLPIPCYFQAFGNRVLENAFSGNGFFGNETNGDLANAVLPYPNNNCFSDNVDVAGKVTSSPSNLPAVCGKPWKLTGARITQELALNEELGCVSLGLCTGLPFPLNTPLRIRFQ